jgi:hypothetical protein
MCFKLGDASMLLKLTCNIEATRAVKLADEAMTSSFALEMFGPLNVELRNLSQMYSIDRKHCSSKNGRQHQNTTPRQR